MYVYQVFIVVFEEIFISRTFSGVYANGISFVSPGRSSFNPEQSPSRLNGLVVTGTNGLMVLVDDSSVQG